MTRAQRAQQLWSILALAATSRQILTYDIVARLTGAMRPGIGDFLRPIQQYCTENGLPPLTCLVVSEQTGLPGEGFIAAADVPAVNAYFWFNLAATYAGSADIPTLFASQRQRVASLMTAQQIARAQDLSSRWRPKKRSTSLGHAVTTSYGLAGCRTDQHRDRLLFFARWACADQCACRRELQQGPAPRFGRNIAGRVRDRTRPTKRPCAATKSSEDSALSPETIAVRAMRFTIRVECTR